MKTIEQIDREIAARKQRLADTYEARRSTMTPRKLPLELSAAEFRERIKMIVGLPKPSAQDRPCVRKPTDLGFYPPTKPKQKENPAMTKFNPENKKTLTYGECLKPAMEITDEADARQYLNDYVAFIQTSLDAEPRKDNMTAARIAGVNLGYFAGYYDSETRQRVERLFDCSHPVFGSIAKNGTPTTGEALEAGKRLRSAQ